MSSMFAQGAAERVNTIQQTKLIEAHIYDYLSELPQKSLLKLYEDQWTVLAVFRSLSPIGRQYVMRMILHDGDFPRELVDSWVKLSGRPAHEKALERLKALKICTEHKGEEEKEMMRMTPLFRERLRHALAQGDMSYDKYNLKPDTKPPTIEELDEYARRKWEAVLRYMARSGSSNVNMRDIHKGVVDLLRSGGLMEAKTEHGERLYITSKGFQFLLKDTSSQVWTLILEYISSARNRGLKEELIISFLFQISFMSLGKDYPVAALGDNEDLHVLLHDLKMFGLIYQRSDSSSRFYLTRPAVNLCRAHRVAQHEGFIILETNNNVYAYTTSKLQIDILSLFVHITCLLPNLTVGYISRESAHEAFANGITASQIVHYLELNAHKRMRMRKFILPDTIVDQLYLWEQEANRMVAEPGVLFDWDLEGFQEPFLSTEKKKYGDALEFAKTNGFHMASNAERGILVVSPEGARKIKEFTQQQAREEAERAAKAAETIE